MSRFDDAEAHSSLSEFLLIIGGSGTMVVDGSIENQVELKERPGEFRGQPIKDGTSYKLAEGDWLVIPPNTPHWPQPDPGGLSYLRMTINLSPAK
jgi:mannose-6-phosphate isomerase-like protein (cupin superfamily)